MYHCPGALYVLVGTKSDLKHDPVSMARLAEKGISVISTEHAQKVAKDVGAYAYYETSALTQTGLWELFDGTARAVHKNSISTNKKGKKQEIFKPQIFPPVLPKQRSAPYVEIITNRFAEDMKSLVNNKEYSDVVFEFAGEELRAHRIVLASASELFHKLFLDHQEPRQNNGEKKKKGDEKTKEKKEDGEEKVKGQVVAPVEVPDEYCCPISAEIMEDPVIAEDGHTYERKSITEWVTRKGTSPMTREPISPTVLILNRVLKGQIDQWKANNQVVSVEKPKEVPSNNRLPPAITSIRVQKDKHSGGLVTRITLIPGISAHIFLHVLEFLYTGLISPRDKELMSAIKLAAHSFECEHLVTICGNILEGLDELNPSIGTWLNDQVGEKMMELFFNKPLYSDVKFLLPDNTSFYGHKCIITARCSVLKRMFSSGFAEAKQEVVKIPDTSKETFSAFLTFLYSAHAPIEDDSCGLLELSDIYGVPRLLTLCELYITKEVERATAEDIKNSDISVVDILLLSQQHGATQLEEFCLHFISSNYQPMSKRDDFNKLSGKNRDYVKENQWPPLSYLKELDEYNKATEAEEGKKEETCCVQ
eukprot:TRINITY_DN3470_c0_g1_i1.p1 TRINITY_DN3470_c0_g1~~TRINITY_DN3470_c0_g1_i1.p1  ORF type:complete len:592 (-),score=112.57 TRINITY_DN3470_c0_g1_i1:19-1794(-)